MNNAIGFTPSPTLRKTQVQDMRLIPQHIPQHIPQQINQNQVAHPNYQQVAGENVNLMNSPTQSSSQMLNIPCVISTVSSLSEGTAVYREPQNLVGPAAQAEDGANLDTGVNVDVPFVPPKEISFTVYRKIPTPEPVWIQEVPSTPTITRCPVAKATPLWTRVPSPERQRPSLSRNNKSNIRFRAAFDSYYAAKTADDRQDTTTEILDYSERSDRNMPPHEYSTLLGQRRRRILRRSFSTTISIGSIVGQSSYLSTSPTLTESSSHEHSGHYPQEFEQEHAVITPTGTPNGRNANLSPTSARRRGAGAGKDLKRVFSKVPIPIRQLTKTGDQVFLHRSCGCLT